MCERVVNWDGGGEIGCNDGIFGFDMYFPSREVWLVLNVFKCHNDVGSFPLIVAQLNCINFMYLCLTIGFVQPTGYDACSW